MRAWCVKVHCDRGQCRLHQQRERKKMISTYKDKKSLKKSAHDVCPPVGVQLNIQQLSKSSIAFLTFGKYSYSFYHDCWSPGIRGLLPVLVCVVFRCVVKKWRALIGKVPRRKHAVFIKDGVSLIFIPHQSPIHSGHCNEPAGYCTPNHKATTLGAIPLSLLTFFFFG